METEKGKEIQDREVAPDRNRTYLFLQNKLKISNPSPWLPLSLLYCFSFLSTLFSLSLSVPVSVLYLHLSPVLCSGSGSGNRSVTCHYWSNSVIRHRALTVCSALYAGTAGVLRTEVEIRFDTHTQARGDRDRRGLSVWAHIQQCVYVYIYLCVCLYNSVKERKHRKDGEIEFLCVCVSACWCVRTWTYDFNRNAAVQDSCALGRDFRDTIERNIRNIRDSRHLKSTYLKKIKMAEIEPIRIYAH